MRIVTQEGDVAPWDGATVGEVEVRGPWITGSYIGGVEQAQFHDGWFRTGDLGALDPEGFLYLSDRLKDTIKSGGESIFVHTAGGRADGPPRRGRGGSGGRAGRALGRAAAGRHRAPAGFQRHCRGAEGAPVVTRACAGGRPTTGCS